jgi:hypothetical protein
MKLRSPNIKNLESILERIWSGELEHDPKCLVTSANYDSKVIELTFSNPNFLGPLIKFLGSENASYEVTLSKCKTLYVEITT